MSCYQSCYNYNSLSVSTFSTGSTCSSDNDCSAYSSGYCCGGISQYTNQTVSSLSSYSMSSYSFSSFSAYKPTYYCVSGASDDLNYLQIQSGTNSPWL